METGTVEIERRKLSLGDMLKIVTIAAAGVWATAAAAIKLDSHDSSLKDHESRLRAVERMEPQVQAMYAVIVERKPPRGINPH